MTLSLGLPGAHHRSTEQQQEIREARRLLKENIRGDWDYPPLPQYQRHVTRVRDEHDQEEQRVAGFRFHHPISDHDRQALEKQSPHELGFEPLEWRERNYSSEESSESESVATSSSHSSKKSTYKFDAPDSVGAQILDRKTARKRKRQKLLDEEVAWNDGLAHWMARRDVWCCAHTSTQVQMLDRRKERVLEAGASSSASASANSTPRTSYSSASSAASASEQVSSPSTTPELAPEEKQSSLIATRPPAPPPDILVPVAPPILENHPIRRRITPSIYPDIYSKIILQSRTPSVPINLMTLISALVQGWKDDGEWPPKQGPVEKSIGRRKKSSGTESTIKSSVKAVGRVLRITSGDSSVGGSHGKEKG